MKRRPMLIAGLLAILILAGVALLLLAIFNPELTAIDPPTPSANDVVSVVGRNFGRAPGSLLFDGIPLQEHSIQVWSPDFISFRMPNDIDQAGVQVRTASGLVSNPLMIADVSRVPLTATPREALEFHPNIASAVPSSGLQIGKLIALRGSHFGDPDPDSALYFSKVPSISTLDTEDSANFIRVGSGDLLVERWSDTSIDVRIPSGAENGYIFVRTKVGSSNTYPISISRAPGRLQRGDAASYTLSDSVSLKVGSVAPDGSLSIFMPVPLSSGQQSVSIEIARGSDQLGASSDAWQEFKFTAAQLGARAVEIARNYTIEVSATKADIATGSIQSFGATAPRFLAPYLSADAIVPSGDPQITAAAASIRKKDKNTFRQIALASQWVFSNFAVIGTATAKQMPPSSHPPIALQPERAGSQTGEPRFGDPGDPRAALSSKSGDMRALVLLDCALLRALGIPSLPVSGFLAGEGASLIPHYWAEYFLLGIGWIPFDPALAVGKGPQGFSGGFSDRLVYYRGIDDRHIEMASGYRALPPVQPGAVKKSSIPWSLFDYDEVAAGVNYSSTWSGPRREEQAAPSAASSAAPKPAPQSLPQAVP